MYRLIKLIGFIIGACVAGINEFIFSNDITFQQIESEQSEVAKYCCYLHMRRSKNNLLPFLQSMWQPLQVKQFSSGSSETLLSIGDEDKVFLTLTLQDNQFKVEVNSSFEEYIRDIATIEKLAIQMKSQNGRQKIQKTWTPLTEQLLKSLIFRRTKQTEAIEHSNGLNTVFLKVYFDANNIQKIKLRIQGAIGFMQMLSILEGLAQTILDSDLLAETFKTIRENSSKIILSLIQHKVGVGEALRLPNLEVSGKGLKADIFVQGGEDEGEDTDTEPSVAASTQIFSIHSDPELTEQDTQALHDALGIREDLDIFLNLDKAIKFGKAVLRLENCNEKLDLIVGTKVLELAYKHLKETGIDTQPSESFDEMIKSIQKFSNLLSSRGQTFISWVETLYDLTKHIKDLDQAVYFHLLQTFDQRIHALSAPWEEEPEHESTCQDSDSVANMADFDEDPVDIQTVDENRKVDQYIQTSQVEQQVGRPTELHNSTTAEMDDKLIFVAIFICVICVLIFIQLVCIAIKISTNSIENEVIMATAAAYTNLLDLFPVVV